MKKLLISVLVLLASMATGSAVFGMGLSADMVSKFGGQVKYSKMYMQDKKFRIDSKASEPYTIMRQDLNKAWVVMPQQKAYMEMKPDPSRLPQDKVKGEVARKFIGNETIDGHPSKKYEVSYRSGKETLRSYQWIASDINFPIKTAALDGSWSMEYKNIKIAPQSDGLFEPPAGYRKMSMPTMPGVGKGMAQEKK